MTWTYSGDPSDSDRDAVRFTIGDTSSTDQQVSDEEIAYLLTSEGSVLGAALAAVRAIIAKYARLVDKSVGDLHLSYSQRLDQYKALMADIRTRMSFRGAAPYAGGITASDKDDNASDTTLTPPKFSRDQFDNDGTDPDSTTS